MLLGGEGDCDAEGAIGGVDRCEAGKEEEGREASPGKLAITSGTPASWMEQVDIRWDYILERGQVSSLLCKVSPLQVAVF